MRQEDKWKKEAAWGQGGTQDSSLTSVGGQSLFRALTSRRGTRPREKTQGEGGSLCWRQCPLVVGSEHGLNSACLFLICKTGVKTIPDTTTETCKIRFKNYMKGSETNIPGWDGC